jgi:hypothetical protein
MIENIKKENSMDKKKLLDVHIETLQAMRVASYKAVSETPEDDASKFMEGWIVRQNLPSDPLHFGFDVEIIEDQTKAGMRGYEVWYSVPESVQASEGVEIKNFAWGLYATTVLDKPFEDPFTFIPAGWKDLHEWVITSDSYRGGTHQWMEQIVPGDGGLDLKLYYPVVPFKR